MKKIYALLTLTMMLFMTALVAQPVLGTTDFAVNGTISWNTNSPCVATKTADVQGWLVSVNSTSNCGINQSNSGALNDSDGRMQYLVGFGTLTQASFGTDDGSEFALTRLAWGTSTYSFCNVPITFIGYRNGVPVPGATLTAITPTAPINPPNSNTTVVTFTGNLNFANVDNVIMVPTQTCSSILFFEDITISSPSLCTVSPTVTLAGSTNASCNGGFNGTATVSASGNGPFTYTWSPSGGNAASASGLSAGIYTVAVSNTCNITANKTVTITQPSALVTTTAITNVSCNGGSNGSATITASGGTGSYTYLWNIGTTSSSISGRLAGAYTATVTDANGCSSIKAAIITQPSALVTSTAVTNVACNGGINGVASITASGGAGSYSYLWSTGNSTSAITGRMAGAYTATVTDANNCTSIKSAVVTQPSALVTSTAVTNVACNGGSNGVASITASGGAGSYTYLWSNGGSTSAITGLLAGAYTATVTDANSCTSIKSAIVTQPSALVTSTAVTNIACNSGSNGSATITASGGAGSYTYLWSNGGSTSAISGLLGGAYTATVTDANSCTSIKSAVVTQPSALVTSTAVTNVACNGGSNGVASITASGGAGSYTYLWSNGGSTSAITGLMVGAYSATVTDANSCTSIKSAVVTQPSALVTSTAITNIACNSGSNGSATITASGGAGSYTYLWSNGATTSAVSGLLAGAYSATVTDANSCTSIKSAVVTQPSAVVTSTAVTNIACNSGSNGSATITASGGAGSYTYLWSNGATTSAISGLLAGAYSATVTDANSCTSIKSAVVTQPSALVTSTAVTNVACNSGSNGSATITASGGVGGYTYLWSNGASTSAISGLLAGAYSATVTDANSCTSTKSAVVTQPSALVTTTAVTNISCNGGSNGSATITASGGSGSYTYLWSNGASASAISGLLAGAYSATVTDANNCASSKAVTITQPSALVTATAVTNAACNSGSNGSATITATGGTGSYTYVWSNGATTSVISGLLAGAYSATVTDANGCMSIKSAIISQPSSIVTTTAVTGTSCNGASNGSATITATGGAGSYTYVWSNGATTSAISGLLAGVYTATVTDANTCSSIKSITIAQPSAIVTTTTVTNVLCNSGNNGSATITASGGTGSYTYLWSNGASTSVVTGLLAGAYTATVTDANNCTNIKSVTVTQPSALVTTTAVSTIPCYGGSNGNATITATGGTGGYTYLWSNGATTSVASGLVAGAYSATVTDANGCTSSKGAVIVQFTALVTTTTVTNNLCNGASNGSATITASGSTGTYTYLWSNGATTSAISGLLAGAYTATVTDGNGCTSIESAIIAQPSAIVTTTAVTNVDCSGGTGSATISASGGTGAYTYLWSNGATTSAVSGLLAGAYSATVTDANNCTTVKSVTIAQPSALTLTVTISNATICSGNSATLTATGNGGTGAINYSWTAGATTNTYAVSPIANTVYSVTILDANNCSKTTTAGITVLTTPTITVNSETICSGNSAVITANGATNYTISGGSFTVSPLVNSTYSVTGTATNGCTGNTAVSSISVNATPTVTVNSATICSGSSVVITPGGSSNYTITGGSFTVSPNTTTSYTIHGTTNGCVSGDAVSTISVNTTPTITLNSGAICPGNTYTLQATGADSYTYSSGSDVVAPSVTTTYSATGTSTNGCAAYNTATATVSVVNTLTVTVSGATNVCSGKTTTLTASGATTYSWTTGATTNTIALSPSVNTTYTVYGASGTCSNNAVVTLSVLTTPTVTINSATICSGNSVSLTPNGASIYTVTSGNFIVTPTANASYTVTGTAANGCVSDAVSTISVNTTPTVTVNSGSVCAGSSLVITPSGATNYTISGGTFTVSPVLSTSYSVTGTGTNGCVSPNAIASVTAYALPTISVTSGAVCPGNSFTLVPSGAATYTYSNGSDVITNPVATANYSVTGTSAQGCPASNTAVATVSVVSSLVISVTGNTTICIGQTASLTANGATNYTWSTGDVTSTVEFTTTATTDYTVSGATGTCSNTAVVTVSVNSLPTITVNSGTICEGTPFVITPTGTDTYSITGNTFTVTPTATAEYTVTGTDLNGCTSAEATSTITVNALPIVTATTSSAILCLSETASLTAGGASTYSWSTTQTDAVIAVTPTEAGSVTYTVWGTDAIGCTGIATVTQVADPCTSVKTLNAASLNAGVYPNPNTGMFTVETSEKAQVIVINSVGQVVYDQAITSTKTNISISHLANGIYFVKVIANGNQQVIKVIKE